MDKHRIIEAVSVALDGEMRVDDSDMSPIRTGKFNESYYLDAPESSLVVRIAPPDGTGMIFYERRMMAQEPGIHKIVREKTDAPVPEILVYDDTRRVIPRDFLVMERLPGNPLTEAFLPGSMMDRVFRRVGECLAQTHRITADKYGYLGEHHPMEPADNWGEAFEVMWNKLIDDIIDCDGYTVDEADSMRRLHGRYAGIFDRDIPASLLHMDVWHQNILVDEYGNVTGLIDWDRALWGDPEIEFAVLDYCGVSTPAFWEGYGRRRDESTEAKIRQALYLLYEIQKYIVIERARRSNESAADRYRSYALSLEKRLSQ